MKYIVPKIVRYIPDVLQMNYPVQSDRDTLDKYIRLALIYCSPNGIRFTLTNHRPLCEEVLDLKHNGSLFRRNDIDEFNKKTLNELEDIVKPKVGMYFKLSKFLDRAEIALSSLDNIPEATKIFMLNFLVDYQSINPNLVLNHFPQLPEEIYSVLNRYDSLILDKDYNKQIYTRLQENFDDFLEDWFLYKGLNVL